MIRFKYWLREYLGIQDITSNQQQLYSDHASLHRKVEKVSAQISTIIPGLGRIIAKLDANYAKDELDPAKRAESDRISEEVIKRLEGEAKARAPYNV